MNRTGKQAAGKRAATTIIPFSVPLLLLAALPIVWTRSGSVHLRRFKQDAARWIEPEQIAPLEQVTLRKTLLLLYHFLSLRAMLWYRFGCWAHEKGIPAVPGAVQRLITRQFGLEIAVGAEIGGGLYIAHPVGTVINVRRIGENCSIIGAVTLGMRNEWAFPSLGDRVFIGVGARVLGGIELGDGALVGANAVVINDIPAGATAVGIPARIIKKAGAESAEANGNQTAEKATSA